MKKVILLVAVMFAMVVMSCKSDHKHGPETHEHEEQTEKKVDNDSDKKDLAMTDAYKCPMDCEKGKTYEVAGKCPTCKMDLQIVKSKKENAVEEKKHSHNEHAGHSH